MKNVIPKALVALAFLGVSGVAHATLFQYSAVLSGAAEADPNLSPGTGTALVSYDDVAHTMQVEVVFSDLLAGVTASHIHGPTAVAGTGTAGVATTTPTFTGFPSGVTFGSYDHTFDLTLATSFNGSFITANGGTAAGAEAALADALGAGRTYLNVHSSMFPAGEIRGFLTRVPDGGATALLLAPALLGCVALARRKRAFEA